MPNFNLKSYFTFLSRNKAYTAVNVFGLAVSLMFVILIGLYAWHEFSVDRQHGKADRIYAVGLKLKDEPKPRAGSHHAVLRYMKSNIQRLNRPADSLAADCACSTAGTY